MGRGRVRGAMVAMAALAAGLTACGGGGDDAVGTWVHPEEGTIVLSDDGSGTITQSSDPVEFDWDRNGDTVEFSFGGDEVEAAATVDGDAMTFRPGDFSGDDPVTFTRE
jgi:hypothetical protein